jgi:hypothetical protein
MFHPHELERSRERDRFDPIRERERYGLSRELSLAIWKRVSEDATDTFGRRNEEQARERFHKLAARIAARGGRLRLTPGRLTRVGVEMSGEPMDTWAADQLMPRVPGRQTLAAVEAQRWAKKVGETSMAGEPVGVVARRADEERERREPPSASEVARAMAALQAGRSESGNVQPVPMLVGPRPAAPEWPNPVGKRTSLGFGLEPYLAPALKEVLKRIGPNHRLRQELIAATGTPTRSFAGMGQWAEPLPGIPIANGNALWQATERHAATLYRRAVSSGVADQHDPAVGSALQKQGTGQPLPTEIRREMEHELGVSLVGVRIHTDVLAAQAARALGAEAFTLGEDIFFAEGTFAPETLSGRKLLAHELMHVVQALRSDTGPTHDGLRLSQPDEPLEREAEVVAERIARMMSNDREKPPTRGEMPHAAPAAVGGAGLAPKPALPAPSIAAMKPEAGLAQLHGVHPDRLTQIFGRARTAASAELPAPPVQRKASDNAESGADPLAVAAETTRGPGGALPHRSQIQASFGHHDVSNIRVFQGSETHDAMQTLGARAFAYGDALAFNGAPDLHTAAHEAAHVVQQRGGVQLAGNIDQPGDVYERHADAVADRVSAGQSAEALLDQMAGGSGARPSVQRKPDDKQPAKDNVPHLPDGMNLQIQSDGSVVVRTAWVESAPDKVVVAKGVQSPSVISAILHALKDAGVLYWMPDAKIREYATHLVLEGSYNSKVKPFKKLSIAFSVYVRIGPPPGANVIYAKSGRGLQGIIRQSVMIPGPIVAETEVELSEPVRNELWTALEQFTGMPLAPKVKEDLVKNPEPWKPHVLPGQEGLAFPLEQNKLERLYGKKQWNDHVDHPKSDQQGSGAISVAGGVQFSSTIPEADRQYFLDWMKQVAKGSKPGDTLITSDVIAKLREIDADPDLKAKILAKLQAGGDGGESKPLTAQMLDNVINAVKTDDAYQKLGMTLPTGGDKYKPLFSEPVRGKIINRGGLNYVDQDTEFSFETQNQKDAFAIPYVYVSWVLTKKDKPTEHVKEGKTHHVEFEKPDTFSYEWKETGIYTVHAFVTHTFYQPAHFEIDVEVKTEQQRTKELNDPAFNGLKGGTTYETGPTDWPFDVSWFNTLFGSHKEEYGKKAWGTTPDDFKRMTYEQRVKFLATDKQRLKDMIAAHTNAKGEPTDARWADMVSYAKDKLKTLEETEQLLGKENTAHNVFFEARGTFLSRKNGIPDKALKLLGSANKDGGDIRTIVHDFTQLYEPSDYTFSATGTTFEQSVEATFVDLAKSYPPGRISCLFEALDDSLVSNQKTVGFELDTGTAWKDVKSVVYNPTVMMAVNIVGAATMVFLPVTAPVLFPMLATYNSIETIDNMAQLRAKGNLTWGNVAKGVAQIGLNFLPYVGEIKVVANMGKVAMYTLEGVTIAGMGVLMTLDGVEQIRKLRDKDISEIGKLDEEVRELERTNPSDPTLPAKKAQLEAMIKQAQDRSTEVIQDMAKSGAVMLVQMGALKGLQAHMTNASIASLKAEGLYEHAPGVDPRYDARTGRIVGDEAKLDAGKISKLKQQYTVDMAAKQAELANVLGTDKIEVTRGGDKVTVTKDGDGYKVQVPTDKPFSEAIDEAWQARKALDPKAPADRPPPIVAEIKPTLDPKALVHEQNVAVGNSVQTQTEAHAILDKLAKGDRSAFKALGIEAPPADFDLRSVEWGIGQKPDGSFIIVRGEPGAVNWSGFGGVRPVAHSHPLTPQKLLTGGSVTFADLIKGGAKLEVNKVNVFPSAADVQFCVAHGLTEHTVQTPYVSKGGGKIGNPAPGAHEPLVSIKIKQPERVGSWGGNDQLGVYKSKMVAVDAKGNELWSGEVWTADHPGLGSVVMFDEPPSGLMTKKVAGAAPDAQHSTKTSDPVKAKWVSDLPGQLSPDEQHRLDLMTKGKSAGEVYDMFGGDLAIAKAKLGGSNLTPELYQKRASLTSDEARRAFDNKWNQMIGGDRAPSDAKLAKFKGYLHAIEKRAGGDLNKGLEAEEKKIPHGAVVPEPKTADYPPSWGNFDPAHNAEFKTKLEEFRGTDFMEQNYAGGEGAVYLGDSKTRALKRWFAKRIGDMATSIAKLRSAHSAVSGNPDLAKHIDVVEIHETGSDWIVRDFATGSEELKNFASGPAEIARTEAIKALEAKLSRSATEDDILGKLKGKSANLHWDPARGKIVIIDMQ